jgi:DUF4097 and DUF4098 domain-containing protein YvlB
VNPETPALSGRLHWMMRKSTMNAAPSVPRSERVEVRVLWILLAMGAALMLAAAASGEENRSSVTRTDRFNASLASGSTVRIENVNGDLVATPGKEFAAVVTTTVTASGRSRAEEILTQTHVEQSNDGELYRLQTMWPRPAGWTRGRHHDGLSLHCNDCKITTRYEIVLPSGVAANLHTVNGEVRVRDLEGDIELHSVNGNVQAAGTRRSLRAQTVNGKVEVSAQALPAAAAWDLKTVNGSVLVTVPKDAKFDWSASTLGGTIASTFALPAGHGETPAAPPAPPREPRAPRPSPHAARAIVVEDGQDGETVIDTEELARLIDESMRDVEAQVRESTNETERVLRRVQIPLPGSRYSARVAGGGARVQVSTLNGNITLLAAGTSETEAKPLVSGRRTVVITVPRVEIHREEIRIPAPHVAVQPAPRVAPLPAPEAEEEEEADIVRGDVSGDFLSTSNGSYQVGRVTGKVKILTHSGEIHIASAGNGADVKTYGGDVRIGPVHGDLKAQTLAGDVRAGEVTGSVTVETSGGDIRIDRVTGSASARTGGGDIVIPSVGGAVQIETGGGEIRVGIVSRLVKGGVAIRNSGGDILLTLPSNFQADIDLGVEGIDDPDDLLIHSEFPGVAVTRSDDAQRASGSLNGGGPRVLVRTASGSIRLRRGPAAPP